MYAYVQNMPTDFVDPSGLNMAPSQTCYLIITGEHTMDGNMIVDTNINDVRLVCFGGGGSSGTGGTIGDGYVSGGGVSNDCDQMLPGTIPRGANVRSNIDTTENRRRELLAQANRDADEMRRTGHPQAAGSARMHINGVMQPGGSFDRWFYGMVQSGGIWDYKGAGEQFEQFGNFNYGAVGAAAGYSLGILQRMAGFIQDVENEGVKSPSMASARLGHGGTYPYGDQLRDALNIAAGFNYFNCLRN